MESFPKITNLLQTVDGSKEQFVELLSARSARLEQILSCGQASEADFWYDQDNDEWVMLVRGQATLQFDAGSLQLGPGDSLIIPARRRHRVAHASEDAIWLALHYST